MSTATPSSLDSIQLPPDAIIHAHTEGKKEGLFAGLTSALASGKHDWLLMAFLCGLVNISTSLRAAHVGSKFMRLKRYPTIACGVITAIASGYLFTKAFTDTHIRRLKQEAAKLSSPNGNESFLSDQ
ncbi:hypothetical protein E1B28_009636 [Marasmius oreades]|uniref:Uncharacterized protein n=1 Tax=Marasmius oreades TaxID=181124 RepID=A0A9P7UQB2_9AGAR|nr:uncharacterized protein E1B28_009636 [Marasmius oreades]KAG7090527.1 hypothetical protein E1B28_009636 [Marasmius oreades]